MKDGRLIKAASKPKRDNTGTLPADRRYAIAYPINNRRITNTAHPHLQELKPVLPWVIHREFIWDPTERTATRPLQFRMPDKKTNHFYMFDGNKNVTDLIYRTLSNGIAAHYDYAPFGAVTRTHRSTPETQFNFIADNPCRFSSEYQDDDLGLVYYNYRHYTPKDGRWLSRDPIEDSLLHSTPYMFLSNKAVNSADYLGLYPADGGIIVSKFLDSNDSMYFQPPPPPPPPPSTRETCLPPYIWTKNPKGTVRDADGCSVPEWLNYILPGAPNNPGRRLDADFEAACNGHDLCYSDCSKRKNHCDVAFYRDMINQCRARYPNPAGRDQLKRCEGWAWNYFRAVDKYGTDPHQTRQQEACHCVCP